MKFTLCRQGSGVGQICCVLVVCGLRNSGLVPAPCLFLEHAIYLFLEPLLIVGVVGSSGGLVTVHVCEREKVCVCVCVCVKIEKLRTVDNGIVCCEKLLTRDSSDRRGRRQT